jgi:hypothetical protein
MLDNTYGSASSGTTIGVKLDFHAFDHHQYVCPGDGSGISLAQEPGESSSGQPSVW